MYTVEVWSGLFLCTAQLDHCEQSVYICDMSKLEQIKIDPLKLRAARGDRKLTEVAQNVGISKQSLWNYENGHNEMPAVTVAKLCILYQIPIESLTTVDEDFSQNMYSRA